MSLEKICVGCERLLRKGESYGFRRGRLWHRECFVLFGGKTVEDRGASAANARAAEASARLTTAEARVRALQGNADRLAERDLERDRERDRERADRVALTRRLSSLERELASTQGELLRAQRSLEVAIATVAAPAATATPAPTAPPTALADERDASEIRFSLLDLD